VLSSAASLGHPSRFEVIRDARRDEVRELGLNG
jgi:hypothetical protein